MYTIDQLNEKKPITSRLTAFAFNGFVTEKSGRKRQIVSCKCQCGKLKDCRVHDLLKGNVRSCGCLLLNRKKTHCLSRNHVLYSVWDGIKRRCYKTSNHNYHLYGALGVTMCDEWRYNFMAFYNWSITNGWEKGLTIDRIEPNGNYEPSNCRYVTQLVNSRNRRNSINLEWNGKKWAIQELSDLFGIDRHKIMYRFKVGYSIEKILSLTNFKTRGESKK